MRNLHIIMPMGGEGSRFSKAGYTTPKPLMRLNGEPFFERAINSVSDLFDLLKGNLKFTFIVRQEHIDKFYIDDIIRYRLSDIDAEINIVAVEKTTRGAVETCLLAKPYIDAENDSILVLDCDLSYYSHLYEDYMLSALTCENSAGIDGLLLSFKSDNQRYSYAKLNENNEVIETAEKNPISNHALIGSYFFTYASDFLRAAYKLMDENDVKDIKEYYVSLLYNYLIRNNKTIKCVDVFAYNSFGTPEELKEYENRSNNN